MSEGPVDHNTRQMLDALENMTAEIAGLRTDVRTEIGQLRTDVRGGLGEVRREVAGLRTETHAGFLGVQGELAELRVQVGTITDAVADIARQGREHRADGHGSPVADE